MRDTQLSVIDQASALVSVCITSYNYGRFLRDAIESALNQTYPHIEVIVSDNGSTDETHAVLAEYESDRRVRVFVNEMNVGLCRNHNLAITRSLGDYIVVLSADDVIFPHHVALLLQRIRDPHDPVAVAAGQGMELDEQLTPISPLLTLGNLPFAYSRRDEFGSLLFNFHHVYPAKLVAREVYERIGLFDEGIITSIDVEFCARLDEAGITCAFVPSFVCGLRSHDSRNSVRSTRFTNELFNDKLYMVERALDPANAWRIEGYESSILAIFDIELNRLREQGAEPLDERQSMRLAEVRRVFAEREAQIPPWPDTMPELSIVMLSEGYMQLAKITLDAVMTNNSLRMEIVIVQTSGYDMTPWIATLPYAADVRVLQVRACDTPAQAFRYGLELARGEYVTYLAEGQRVGDEIYATVVRYMRETAGQMAVLPKERVDDYFPLQINREQRYHQFLDPACRARMRAEGGPYALCQLTHRRGILRASTIFAQSFYDGMISHAESDFVAMLTSTFRTVTFAAA